MAEIRIEKKQKPVWPWILGVLFVLVVVWIAVEAIDDEDTITREGTEIVGTQEEMTDVNQEEQLQLATVQEYSSYIEENAELAEMGKDHEFTVNGIRLLSDALNEIVDEVDADVNMQQKGDNLRNKADEIQADPQGTQHANKVQEAFMSAAELLNDLKNNHFQNLEYEVSNVQETAEAIDPNVETLKQSANIQAFFASANQALQEMSSRITNEQAQGIDQSTQDQID